MSGKKLAAKIASHPAWFAEKIFGVRVWPKQAEVISSPFQHKRTAVRGCVSSTKTFAAALTTWAWLLAHPGEGRVFHLAPSFRQVDKNMWGYIKALDIKAKHRGTPTGAHVFKEPRIVFKNRSGDIVPGWEYNGFSTDSPHNVHGIHGPKDLIILDDAHGIPKTITDELENMFAGGDTRLLMLFNPVVTSGETYDCAHSQKALWNNIKISFENLEEAYRAGYDMSGALQRVAVEEWAKKFGTQSSFYRSKVDAEYPAEEKDCVIPLSWIEAACMREVPDAEPGQIWHGVDVARFGDDESARCTIEGRRQLPIDARSGERTTETAGRLIAEIRKKGGLAAVDVIGVGSGVVDVCHSEKVSVMPINVAESSGVMDETGQQKFTNLRSEMYWLIRECLDPNSVDPIALDPDDKQLHGELATIKWRFDTKGRIAVESKDDIRKRLLHSTDRADALGLALLARKRSKISITLPPSIAEMLTSNEGGQMSALEGLALG